MTNGQIDRQTSHDGNSVAQQNGTFVILGQRREVQEAQLSQRGRTCSVSLKNCKVTQGHSRSFEITPMKCYLSAVAWCMNLVYNHHKYIFVFIKCNRASQNIDACVRSITIVIHYSLNTCLSCTVTEIFNVEYWRDLEICVMGRSRSLNMAPIDR